MATSPHEHPGFIRDLGDGLILRRATVADADALAEFSAEMHRNPGSPTPDMAVGVWTRDLVTRPHPTFAVGDFTIVEDVASGAIVSSIAFISQTWAYNGITFGVGRPELVATHPDYRRRGLVRAQFDVVHGWSAERGELVQGITGIPYYYRQFGYEMAVDLGGGREAYSPSVPALKEGEAEPYRMRPATEADLPLVSSLYDRGARYCLTCVRDMTLWRYELNGRSPGNAGEVDLRIIETPEGEAVGYIIQAPRLWGHTFWVSDVEVKPGVPWLKLAPCVLRHFDATAKAYAAKDGGKVQYPSIGLSMPAQHPLRVAAERRLPQQHRRYAWYLRVPDVPAFIRHVAPVLEQRLAASPFAGYAGDLKVSFYRTGVKLAFAEGKLAAAEAYRPETKVEDSAAFPGLTFLQLLFGYRDLEELQYAFPDAWAGDEARAILPVLFPKQASFIWPVS
ncbi:MAG: GNAT family N-acetyltransferase [Anaerolineae bacterium]